MVNWVNLLLWLSCMIVVASSMTFRLTLPTGQSVEGDIDKLDEVKVGKVNEAFANTKSRRWARKHLSEIIPLEPHMKNVKVEKITSPTESLDYLEDLIQENDPVVQAFVIELFFQAGMRLELFPCKDK